MLGPNSNAKELYLFVIYISANRKYQKCSIAGTEVSEQTEKRVLQYEEIDSGQTAPIRLSGYLQLTGVFSPFWECDSIPSRFLCVFSGIEIRLPLTFTMDFR